MTKVLVSDPIADKGIAILEDAQFDVIYNPNPSNDELQNYSRDINAWIVRSGTKITSEYLKDARNLMFNKNHDYDEAWRDMRISSFTDLILTKLMRIKQIEDNQGQTLVSEGIDANYFDIINYSIFALIKIEEKVNC